MLVVAGGLLLHKSVYLPRYDKAQTKLDLADKAILTAETFSKNKDQFQKDIDWIARYEPKPVSLQNAKGALQKLCESQALRNELEIRTQKFLDSPESEEGKHYRRASYQLTLTGKESSFYKWLVALDNPIIFQRVTSLTLYPNKADDTLIEGRVVVEKWFKPTLN